MASEIIHRWTCSRCGIVHENGPNGMLPKKWREVPNPERENDPTANTHTEVCGKCWQLFVIAEADAENAAVEAARKPIEAFWKGAAR